MSEQLGLGLVTSKCCFCNTAVQYPDGRLRCKKTFALVDEACSKIVPGRFSVVAFKLIGITKVRRARKK